MSTTTTTGSDADAKLTDSQRGLVERHMAHARAVASRYEVRGVDPDDLEAEAYLGLIDAARRFLAADFPEDSFAAYATKLIRTRIRLLLQGSGAVRLTRATARRAIEADDGHAATTRPYPIAVEHLGMMAPDPDRRALSDLVAEIVAGLDGEAEAVIHLVALDGLTVHRAARELGMPWPRALAAHDRACRAIAGELRRRGWDEDSWAQAIA